MKRIRNNRVPIMSRMAAMALIIIAAVGIIASCAVYNASAKEQRPLRKYYTSIEVASGQSLWSIAGEYMTEEYADREEYVEEVARLNHLKDNDMIHAGAYLTIPYYAPEISD